jgi:hypothetical protein
MYCTLSVQQIVNVGTRPCLVYYTREVLLVTVQSESFHLTVEPAVLAILLGEVVFVMPDCVS